MRAAAVAVAAAVALAYAGCLVDRRTPDLECDDTAPCRDGRVCDRGYCISAACPGDCTTCDVLAKTCTILCDSPNQGQCNTVSCPNGYSCAVQCVASNACGDVSCVGGEACTVLCSGTNACGDVRCGRAACQVTCTGVNACAVVDCNNSCSCDASCEPGVSCTRTDCPTGDVQQCTVDGTDATVCSSLGAGCATC